MRSPVAPFTFSTAPAPLGSCGESGQACAVLAGRNNCRQSSVRGPPSCLCDQLRRGQELKSELLFLAALFALACFLAGGRVGHATPRHATHGRQGWGENHQEGEREGGRVLPGFPPPPPLLRPRFNPPNGCTNCRLSDRKYATYSLPAFLA